jgi:hypothetical protein
MLQSSRRSGGGTGASVRTCREDFVMPAGHNGAAHTLSWSFEDDQRLKEPQRQLLDAIAVGDLDPHLVAIADAVQARRELLRTVAAATALAQLCVGDDVMINQKVRPRYLAHEAGTVVEVDDRSVVVRLWRPVGRFHDGIVRCPPLALHKLPHADAGA